MLGKTCSLTHFKLLVTDELRILFYQHNKDFYMYISKQAIYSFMLFQVRLTCNTKLFVFCPELTLIYPGLHDQA